MFLEIGKIQQATAYLSNKIENLYLTKFLKLMYYFDFISVLERGVPITNDTYYHLPYGPVPSFIKDQIVSLKDEWKKSNSEALEIETDSFSSIFLNFVELDVNKKKSIIKTKADFANDFSYLSEYEKTLLDDIVSQFKDVKTPNIVKQTHAEPPYIQTPENNVIDYRLAFYLDRDKILPNRQYQFDAGISQAEFFNTH